MADYPNNLKYTKEHEWVRQDGNTYVVGITMHAQEALGDVVYVELPKAGSNVTAGKQFGVVESTKAVSELYAPISGKVVKVNDELSKDPQAVNTDPYGKGWMIAVEPTNPSELAGLMDADAYQKFLATSK